jgi:hypothetical protein
LVVGQCLGVGEPGPVIDRGVQEVVTDPGLLVPLRHRRVSAVSSPAAAGRDLAELLDVDVHQIAGRPMLIATVGGP